MSVVYVEDVEQGLPDRFSISVIMEQSPSVSPWADEHWEAIGVSAGTFDHESSNESSVIKIYEQNGVRRFLNTGFHIQLYVDECESYYHNLMVPSPRCFVVAEADENEVPVPFLITLSFDEAQAYLEGDEVVYSVGIPPELYRWSEAFVLAHYVPQKKTKRKLKDWKADGKEGLAR